MLAAVLPSCFSQPQTVWVTPWLLVCCLAEDRPRHMPAAYSVQLSVHYWVKAQHEVPHACCQLHIQLYTLDWMHQAMGHPSSLRAAKSDKQLLVVPFFCVCRCHQHHTQPCCPGVTEKVPHAAKPFPIAMAGFQGDRPSVWDPLAAGGYWLVGALRCGLLCPGWWKGDGSPPFPHHLNAQGMLKHPATSPSAAPLG